MQLQQRFTILGVVALALTVVFMFVGLPYADFTWADVVTDYNVPEVPTAETPPLEPLADVDPESAPPVYIDETEGSSVEDSLPEGSVLYAPAVPLANIGVGAVVDRALTAYDFVLYIDGRSSAEPFLLPITVCLKDPVLGSGLIFLAADQAPRVPVNMPVHYEGNYACTQIDRPGTLVLVSQ